MDYIDFKPKYSPVINGAPYCYSIGVYHGRKRVVIAWFADETSANDYLVRCRRTNPYAKFDCFKSLF